MNMTDKLEMSKNRKAKADQIIPVLTEQTNGIMPDDIVPLVNEKFGDEALKMSGMTVYSILLALIEAGMANRVKVGKKWLYSMGAGEAAPKKDEAVEALLSDEPFAGLTIGDEVNDPEAIAEAEAMEDAASDVVPF